MPSFEIGEGEGEAVVIDWQKWTKEKEQEYLAEGRPVYIDFTAKWCVTCQVNKKTAYTQEVVDLMNRHDVVFMKADKTTKNPEIDAELPRFGRSAIPVNVLYTPEEKEPIVTTEILSPGILIDLINDNLGELPSQVFNEENFEEALASGDPVLVNYKAKWGLLSAINDKVLFSNDNVQQELLERRVRILTADVTEGFSPFQQNEMAKLGRSAVPVVAVYLPNQSEPLICPEVCEPEVFLELLEGESIVQQ